MIARLTFKSLAAHKLRLGLTAIAVIIGTAFVSGTFVYSDTTNKAFDDLFTQTGKDVNGVVRAKESFDTTGDFGEGSTRPSIQGDLLEKIRGVDGVERAVGSLQGDAQLFKGDDAIGGNGPPTIGVNWSDDAQLSSMTLIKGNAPKSPNEIAIDSKIAKKEKFKTGQQVTVAVNGKAQTFNLVGIFRLGPSGYTGGATFTAFEPKIAEQLLMDKPGTFKSIQIHAKSGVSEEQLRKNVSQVLPQGTEAITGKKASDENAEGVKGFLKFLNIFLLIFAIVSVFVGAFIIFNTFSMLVTQRSREMALLRAIGASRKQVTQSVMGEAIGVGVFGSTVGLVTGLGLAAGLKAMFTSFGIELPSSGLILSPKTVLWTYAVGIVVTLFAAYFPARRAAKTPPVAAMRDDTGLLPARSLRFRVIGGAVVSGLGALTIGGGFAGSGGGGAALVGIGALLIFLGVAMLSPIVSKPVTRVLGWPFAKLAGSIGNLSRQNAQRNPRRTAATASALMIGLALVSLVTVLASTVNASVEKDLDEGLGADFWVRTSSFTPFDPEAAGAITKVPGVASAVGTHDVKVKVDGSATNMTAGDTQALAKPLKLEMKSGSNTTKADEMLVGDKEAKAKGWKVGERLPGEYPDGTKTTLTVAGVFKQSEVSGPMILGLESYKAHFESKKVTMIFVNLASGTDAKQAEQALESTLKAWPSLKLQDQKAIKDEVKGQVNQMLMMIMILLVLSIVIAILGIINTLALSVIERTREIGLLRAVGMSRRQLRRTIRYEAVVISVFGALLGLAVGLGFGVVLQAALKDTDGFSVLAVPTGQLLIYVGLAALIGVFAAIWPARRAARMDVLHAITVE